jgi:hypothetical protein
MCKDEMLRRARFEVFVAVKIQVEVFQVVMLYSDVAGVTAQQASTSCTDIQILHM